MLEASGHASHQDSHPLGLGVLMLETSGHASHQDYRPLGWGVLVMLEASRKGTTMWSPSVVNKGATLAKPNWREQCYHLSSLKWHPRLHTKNFSIMQCFYDSTNNDIIPVYILYSYF